MGEPLGETRVEFSNNSSIRSPSPSSRVLLACQDNPKPSLQHMPAVRENGLIINIEKNTQNSRRSFEQVPETYFQYLLSSFQIQK